MAYSFLATLTSRALGATAGIAMLAGAATAPFDAARAAEETVWLKYHVYAASMRIAVLKMAINLTEDGYTFSADFETKGLIDLFAGTEFEAQARGRHSAGDATPEQFNLVTDNNDGKRSTVVTWNGDGAPGTERSYQLAAYRVEDLANHLEPGVRDPLSVLISASLATSDKLCTGTYQAFDGKEMYDLTYRLGQRDDFTADNAGVYRGEAYQCEITYRPVAGMSNSKRERMAEDGDNGEDVYKVWMAPVHSAALDRTLYVPVGSVGEADGFGFYLFLDHATISGNPLNSQSAASQ